MPEDFDQEGLQAAFEAAKGTTVAEAPVETATVETPPAATETVVETPAVTTETEPKFNPSEYFKTTTEGFIDSEEKFKEFIPKIKNYDDLETKLKDLETKVPNFKNEESKRLFELWQAGEKKAVRDYIADTERDYNVMSDLDIIRIDIAKKHPEWDSKGIELEVRGVYGKQLNPIDLESIQQHDEEGKVTQEYRDALAHNERVEENAIRIQRDARDFRTALIENQKKIELPQLAKAEAPPVQNGPTEDQIAEAKLRWKANVDENLPKLSNLKMNINDKEVEYVRTEEEKKEIRDYMESFNIYKMSKELGWMDDNGNLNSLKIAEDRDKVVNFDKIVKSFGTQLATTVTKDTLKKIKNIPDTIESTTETNPEPGSLAEAFTRARSEAGWQQ